MNWLAEIRRCFWKGSNKEYFYIAGWITDGETERTSFKNVEELAFWEVGQEMGGN